MSTQQPNTASYDLHWKPVLGVFVLTLVLYLIGFNWIEGKREDKGPWQIIFEADLALSKASIIIEQPELNISPTQLSFLFPADQLQSVDLPEKPETILFALNQQEFDLPFGELTFRDPTFLPGVVTIELFGNVVECLPRVLILNKEEISWNSKTNITIECPDWEPEIEKEAE